jgi:hypothetical protein
MMSKQSNDVFEALYRSDLDKYQATFRANPATCTACGHTYVFEDRLMAAIKESAHPNHFIKGFLADQPRFPQSRDGKIHCPSCDKIEVIHLAYHYPNNMD